MKYRVKWIEDNLGITRDALRYLEKQGVLPKNKDKKPREYDDDDIHSLWLIRVLQGIGYSTQEIVDMASDEGKSIDETIGDKICKLEKVQKKIALFLGYAKMIKLTGRFPAMPKDMGSVKFDDFYRKTINEWNLKDFPIMDRAEEVIDAAINKPAEQWTEQDLDKSLQFIESLGLTEQMGRTAVTEDTLCRLIIKKQNLSFADTEVQVLVKCLYENLNDSFGEENKMTEEQFGRIYSSSFVTGDIARLREHNYGKDACMFIANAIAVFGGYKNAEEAAVL